MVHQNAASDSCGRVNINAERFRHSVLEIQRQQFTALSPKPVRNAVANECMHSFQKQQWHHVAGHGRVAFADGTDVRTDGLGDGRILLHRVQNDFSQLHGGKRAGSEFSRQVVTHGVFEAFMIEDRGVEKTGQHRLRRRPFGRSFANR